MAKSPKSKAKKAKAKKARAGKYQDAVRALEAAGVPQQEFGNLNRYGIPEIDFQNLEKFKRKLGSTRLAKVRFVAVNAPFKRRSAIPPG
jgi:hypothetical protein